MSLDAEAIKRDIRDAIITDKATATPITVRLAWHSAGTFDKNDGSGGSNGAGMRFEPEATDAANNGLSIVRDLLLPVKEKHPGISHADLWTLAGCAAIEFAGGPKIPHQFGRSDHPDGSCCPANGRLPDASQGAQHLRDVFYRMGFNDRDIVALSGAHTLGRCHRVRSGFDGPWTTNPLRFDNEYFRNLVELEWRKKEWDGPTQFEDVKTGELMMLPTDMALIEDAEFRKFVELYAKDEAAFFRDFADAYKRLLENGCPFSKPAEPTPKQIAGNKFREAAMHGSIDVVRQHAAEADVNEADSTGRTALHKAAFWGHEATVNYLANELKLNVNAQDSNGDTPLHDAARFGHSSVVEILLKAGSDPKIQNAKGKDVATVANDYGKANIAKLLGA